MADAMIHLPDNGQEFTLPEEWASDDSKLKQALKPLYPEVGDAKISRETKDGVMHVTVVKQAGKKGAGANPEDKIDEWLVDIAIDKIRTDGGTQARAALSEETIGNYTAALMMGDRFPPITVFFDGEFHWLADGFHRLEAHRRAGNPAIWADYRRGTRRDAVLYAAGANAQHGLPRNNADKRRAVEVVLQDPEWAKWSDREIAERVAVSHTLVATIRRELSGNGFQMPQERLAHRGGTTYTFQPAQPKGEQTAPEMEQASLVEPAEEEVVEEISGDAVEPAPAPVAGRTPLPKPVAPAPAPAPIPVPVPVPAPAPLPVTVGPLPWEARLVKVSLEIHPALEGRRQKVLVAMSEGVQPIFQLGDFDEEGCALDVAVAIAELKTRVEEAVAGAQEAKAS